MEGRPIQSSQEFLDLPFCRLLCLFVVLPFVVFVVLADGPRPWTAGITTIRMEFDYPHSSPTSPPSSPTTTFQHHRRERPILGHAKTHFTTSTTTRKVLVSLCLLCLSVLLVAVGASAEPEEQTSLSSSLCDPDGPLALGMESGAIADSALSASSAYEMLHVGPNNAR